MKQSYRIGGVLEFADEGPEFQAVLSRAQSAKSPVLCGCRDAEDLRLYISKRFGRFVLSRWPGSGGGHATACDHFELPDFLSGMGQVRGAAVLEDEATGEASLKVNFPMSRGAARVAPSALSNDKPSVKSTGYKLSMRGLLHVLWDRAQLTHWHPGMLKKRSWFVVRRALLEAADACRMKTLPLCDLLFIPESWREDDKEGIAKRRVTSLERVRRSRDEMLMIIAEIKEYHLVQDRLKITFKHLGDMRFVLDPDMTRRFYKRFEGDLNLFASDDRTDCHLILAGSFCRRPEGTYDLIEVALMPVNRQWLPYETGDELELVKQCVREERRFVKGLRVNLDRNVPIASLVLKDMGERVTAVHIHDSELDIGDPLKELMTDDRVDHVLWSEGVELPLPPGRVRQAAKSKTARPVSPSPAHASDIVVEGEAVAAGNVDGRKISDKQGFEAYADS